MLDMKFNLKYKTQFLLTAAIRLGKRLFGVFLYYQTGPTDSGKANASDNDEINNKASHKEP